MPYLFKLSKRVAQSRCGAFILTIAAAFACDPGDPSLSGPADPSYATTDLKPAAVSDLAVGAVTDTSATLSFTEVDDGLGNPASYDVRYAVQPISWGSAQGVTWGTCTVPVSGSAIGARQSCTVLGLSPSTGYEFQLVPFRGMLNVNAVFGGMSNIASGTTAARGMASTSECATPRSGWIWCDDFEQDRLNRYFEYDNAGGTFVRASSTGFSGSTGMRARYAAVGQVGAGALHLAFGKTPQAYFRPVDAGMAVYREVYWRMYVRNQPGWTGGGADKLSRAMSLASSSSWAQAMIAHVWSGSSPNQNYLYVDPASGTDASGNLSTTTYNDFGNLRWLGAARSATPIFDATHVGQWYCVEAHAKLNDAGASNGVFELWIDGNLGAERTGLNWVGFFSAYGINAVFFENYWNAGAPQPQERYFDNIVVSTQRIGCVGSTRPPPPPATTQPGMVTDLAVSGTTDTSVTLSFTEVNDGTGKPALYDVRYAAGTISWGSASQVSRGTCATPVVGSAIGAKRTCTVLGLSAASAYGFQVAAFRGTLNLNAVFGGLSNVASGTTGIGRPVASVAVSPGNASVGVGGTQPFTPTLKDASGNVLSGRTVTWSSSNPAVATVSASGIATALVAGTATMTAASEGRSGTAALTVTAPAPGGSWPHEPAGWTALAEHSGDVLTPAGWSQIWNDYGYESVAVDATAPFSPAGVLQYRWPVGWTNQVGMGALVHGLPGVRRAFVGIWWKPSNPWQGHVSNTNKIQYLFTNGSGSIFMAMYGPPGGPFEIVVFPQFSTSRDRWLVPNVNRVNVTLGQWHRIEWLVDYSGPQGRIQWWLDGVLLGDYSDDPSPPEGFSEYKLHPVWGGAEAIPKTQTDYYWYDHVHITGR